MINKLFLTTLIFLFTLSNSIAAGNQGNSFIDSAKFFVVVSVLSTILLGIFFLLFYLERKISNLEKQSTKQ